MKYSEIKRGHREKLNSHKSFVLWFTGFSGAGKSTLAKAVEHTLHSMGKRTYILDGDNLRKGLNQDLGFSAIAREENIRRVGAVSALIVDAGVITLASLISPFRASRSKVRSMHLEGDFIEVYVKCPLQVCEERDTKGLYKKARQGLIPEFTGISSPYEPPENSELVIDTSILDLEKSVEIIMSYLKEHNYI